MISDYKAGELLNEIIKENSVICYEGSFYNAVKISSKHNRSKTVHLTAKKIKVSESKQTLFLAENEVRFYRTLGEKEWKVEHPLWVYEFREQLICNKIGPDERIILLEKLQQYESELRKNL